MFDVREGLLTLLVGVPTLLLGVLVARGRGERRAVPHFDAPPVGTRQETGNGPAAAGALLEATMNGMRDGVLVVDEHLRIVSANKAARAVFVRGGEIEAGQPLSALTRNPAVNAAFRAAVERRADTQVRVELSGADRRVLELRVTPLEVEGACEAIGVFLDITELERLSTPSRPRRPSRSESTKKTPIWPPTQYFSGNSEVNEGKTLASKLISPIK